MHELRNRITKLMFVTTGSYNPMVSRPYTTSATEYNLLKLAENTEQGKTLNETTVAGVCNQILKPAVRHEGLIQIPNGWNEKRLMFMMEVITDQMGAQRKHWISGYTDAPLFHVINGNQTVYAHDMQLFVNNVITVQNTAQQLVGIGNHMAPRLQSADRVIRGSTNLQFSPNFGGQLQGDIPLRPTDVFNRMDMKHIGAMNNNAFATSTEEMFNGIKMSRIANDKPSNYLANTLTAFNNAMDSSDREQDTLSDVMRTAKTSVRESEVKSDPLFYQLGSFAPLFFTQGMFTYGQLLQMQPDLANIEEHYESYPARKTTNNQTLMGLGNIDYGTHGAGMTQSWEGGQQETMAATIISQSVPALLSECLIMSISLSVTNHGRIMGAQEVMTPKGVFYVLTSSAQGFGDFDLIGSGMYQKFINKFINEVIYDVTMQNGISINLHGEFTVGVSETRMQLQLDGRNPEMYNAPSFTDSLFSPVVGKSLMTLDTLAKDFTAMQDVLSTNFSPVSYNAQHAVAQPIRFDQQLINTMQPFNGAGLNVPGNATKSSL